MEILNLNKRVGYLIGVLCSLTLIFTFLAFAPLGSNGELVFDGENSLFNQNNNGIVALADNSGTIGSGGGSIEIADVTEGLVNQTYSSREQGRKLKITMPLATVSVYFAYELDTSEQIWAISGKAGIDEDIPYMLHEGKVEKHEVPSKTLNQMVVSSWTDIEIVNDKRVFYVEVEYNGMLYVECTLNGESDRLKADSLVKDIDCISPKMQTGIVAHGLRNENDQAVFECTATFQDGYAGSALASARSGLGEILIIRTDVALGDMTEENLNNAVVENICSWEPLSPNQIVLSQKVTFNIEKEGYYYYFVVDRVGNLQINEMLGGKFSREDYAETDSRFDVTDPSAGSSGVTYSVKNYMITIGEELGEYKDEVTNEVYDKAVEAYSTLLLRFYSGESQTNRESISNAYFSFYRNEYTAFKNAYSVGASYITETVNGELLKASLKCLNLNLETVKSLGGDEVKASFLVARYEDSDLDSALLNLYNRKGNVKAYKLSYSLTVNGVQATVPKSPLVFEFFGISKEMSDFVIYQNTPNGYVECEQLKGENWLRFTSTASGADYYLLYVESTPQSNLLPLWITLGVVGGLLLIGGIVLLVLWKKGIIAKRGAK